MGTAEPSQETDKPSHRCVFIGIGATQPADVVFAFPRFYLAARPAE